MNEENKEATDDLSQLEMEFRKVVTTIRPEIQAKLEEANKLLEEAVKLAEDYGVAFEANISQLSQSYRPKSLSKWLPLKDLKCEKIYTSYDPKTNQPIQETWNNPVINEILGMYLDDDDFIYGFRGWEHSAVC